MKKLSYIAFLAVCCCVFTGCNRSAAPSEIGRFQLRDDGGIVVFDTATGQIHCWNKSNQTWVVFDPVAGTIPKTQR